MSFVFMLFMLCVFTMPTYAASQSDNNDIETIYKNAYKESKAQNAGSILDDYDCYAYLLHNIDYVNVSNAKIAVSQNIYNNLNSNEKALVKDFVKRLNILIDNDAINVNSKLEITKAPTPIPQAISKIRPDSLIMELMPEARTHASQLKTVYDNAPFGKRHIVAGLYFTERVKSGGIWDYKRYMGLNTRYYIPEIGATMTGETIGNFHYGYVGRACFGATTLKGAAGLVQLIDRTSDISYWNSYFDDPRDQKDIQWGINVYNREH